MEASTPQQLSALQASNLFSSQLYQVEFDDSDNDQKWEVSLSLFIVTFLYVDGRNKFKEGRKKFNYYFIIIIIIVKIIIFIIIAIICL